MFETGLLMGGVLYRRTKRKPENSFLVWRLAARECFTRLKPCKCQVLACQKRGAWRQGMGLPGGKRDLGSGPKSSGLAPGGHDCLARRNCAFWFGPKVSGSALGGVREWRQAVCVNLVVYLSL